MISVTDYMLVSQAVFELADELERTKEKSRQLRLAAKQLNRAHRLQRLEYRALKAKYDAKATDAR